MPRVSTSGACVAGASLAVLVMWSCSWISAVYRVTRAARWDFREAVSRGEMSRLVEVVGVGEVGGRWVRAEVRWVRARW